MITESYANDHAVEYLWPSEVVALPWHVGESEMPDSSLTFRPWRHKGLLYLRRGKKMVQVIVMGLMPTHNEMKECDCGCWDYARYGIWPV